MTLKNPFADYGGIVIDDRFIGRQDEILTIHNRLLGSVFGNIAIIGLPRIGKSSLAWNSIIIRKEELINRGILPVWISFGEYSSLTEVFDEVFLEIIDVYKNQETLIKDIKSLNEKYFDSNSQIERRRHIKKYLKFLRSKSLRLILLLDEFDNAKNILQLQDFQFLREISNNPDTKIGLLTISRNTIQELEPENGALSNFYQIFTELRLKLFDEQDYSLYWNRIRNLGLKISEEYIEFTKYYCGHHPYLIDALNNEIFNRAEQTDVNLDNITKISIKELMLKMYNEYDSILKLMKLEGLERMLMQMIVGPVYDITQRDVEKLFKYDLVTSKKDGSYSSFSEYFNIYLHIVSREIDIWPLWSEVENEIRSLIKENLLEKFGEEWEESYIKLHKQKGVDSFISEKREMRNRNKKSFGEKASDSLVDYTYPLEMFDRFIAYDWSWFSLIFGKQKNDWKPIFEHLGKIRNPLAHNNPNFLTDSDKNIAEGYCKIILEKIQNWKSQ